MRVWGMRDGISITLDSEDRERLEVIAADRNAAQKHVWRARIVLLSADGVGTNAIMARTAKSKTTVWRWQARFMEAGVDGLLRDKSEAELRSVLSPKVAGLETLEAVTRGQPLECVLLFSSISAAFGNAGQGDYAAANAWLDAWAAQRNARVARGEAEMEAQKTEVKRMTESVEKKIDNLSNQVDTKINHLDDKIGATRNWVIAFGTTLLLAIISLFVYALNETNRVEDRVWENTKRIEQVAPQSGSETDSDQSPSQRSDSQGDE